MSSFSALLVPDQTCPVTASSVDVLASKSRETAPFLLAPGAALQGGSPSSLGDSFGILAVYKQSPHWPCCNVWHASLHSNGEIKHLMSPSRVTRIPTCLTKELTFCCRAAFEMNSTLCFPKLLRTLGLLQAGKPWEDGRADVANPISQMRRLRFRQLNHAASEL